MYRRAEDSLRRCSSRNFFIPATLVLGRLGQHITVCIVNQLNIGDVMNNYTQQMQQELSGMVNSYSKSLMPYFEIAVIREGEEDWILCELFFQGNCLVAERESVNTKEEKSKYIASNRIVVDSCLTLDEHLQELYAEVLESIREGDLYTLAD